MGERALPVATPLAITGCGVLSSIGTGLGAFMEALCADRSGRVPVADLFDERLPESEACIVQDFQVSHFLGKKGTSFFDRITSLAVVTCGLALQQSGLVVSDENRRRIGVVLGTSTGSLKSASDYSRETMVQERPYLVNPILFANTILNCAAGQAAVWYSLKGVNSTVAGGQLSSLMAIRYAGMAIRQGYADILLAGGVEEFTPHSAWALHHIGILKGTDTLFGEGCAVFVVEAVAAARAAGREPFAELLACEVSNVGFTSNSISPNGRSPYGDQPTDRTKVAQGLALCIQRALIRAAVTPDEVWAVSSGATGNCVLDSVEEEGIHLALGRRPIRRLQVKKQVGECYSAAGALQLAGLLALYLSPDSLRAPTVSLVLSVGEDGGVGCAVIRGACSPC
ncbi:MAG: hypothetical protein L0332_23880 [Chloroflexi bacterium]|nr:hypothetical protein [Chloroflexota bacterium]